MSSNSYRTANAPVRRGMQYAFAAGSAACIAFALLYRRCGWSWARAAAVTGGAVACHMALHFLAPVILALACRRQYRADSWWFRPKAWEAPLYRFLRVKAWKKSALTYDPREFSLKEHSIEEVINNMCHSEAVHELSAALAFTTLLLAVPFGAFPVFLLTAILAAGIDLAFAAIQRYNRPRLMRIRDRRGGDRL